jgi:hypothetical protein
LPFGIEQLAEFDDATRRLAYISVVSGRDACELHWASTCTITGESERFLAALVAIVRQSLVGRQRFAAPLRLLAIAVGHPCSRNRHLIGPNVPGNWRSRWPLRRAGCLGAAIIPASPQSRGKLFLKYVFNEAPDAGESQPPADQTNLHPTMEPWSGYRYHLSWRDLLRGCQPPGFAFRIRKLRQLEISTIRATQPVMTGNPTSRAYARVLGDTRLGMHQPRQPDVANK